MDDYYDINSNRIFVRGVKDLKAINDSVIFKKLMYPTVVRDLYYINEYGTVINSISNTIMKPFLMEGYPCVNLSSVIDGTHTIERFRVVDLVAYNFIRNSDSYLERGYIAINNNCIETDNHYTNIVYVSRE